jgi:hypothetical protein
MNVNFFLSTPSGKEFIAKVIGLEVVPNGIYEIDGVEYTTVSKPTFHIKTTNHYGFQRTELVDVDMLVMKV